MEIIEWTLAAGIGILLLLVLMLGLLAVGAWLVRLICRIWNDTAPARRHEQPSPRASTGEEADV
ncbi:MAG TPA: hypothetical protein VJ966_18135 [Actinomycetes bacterium]|nr:hypothetical protein [Actinomycetes bacterium]